jgi:hypothetical protein
LGVSFSQDIKVQSAVAHPTNLTTTGKAASVATAPPASAIIVVAAGIVVIATPDPNSVEIAKPTLAVDPRRLEVLVLCPSGICPSSITTVSEVMFSVWFSFTMMLVVLVINTIVLC